MASRRQIGGLLLAVLALAVVVGLGRHGRGSLVGREAVPEALTWGSPTAALGSVEESSPSDGAVASADVSASSVTRGPGGEAPPPTTTPVRWPADPPARDLIELAARLGSDDGAAPSNAGAVPGATLLRADQHDAASAGAAEREAPPPCEVGATSPFWLHDIENRRYLRVQARVVERTDNLCAWVQELEQYDAEGLASGARVFSSEIIPRLREAFGEEWSPGVDGDTRIHVLHHQSIPGVAGFFSSSDEAPPSADPYSNGREMFYINLAAYRPGTYDYLSLLAHEFQHMVHFNADRDESGWVNEGLSELAAQIAGYGTQSGAAFFADPDTALLEWEPESGANAAHYAAAYSFFAFLQARFGEGMLKAVAQASGNGPAGVEQALASIGRPMAFDQIFADWVVANLVGGYGDAASLGTAYDYAGLLSGAVVPDELPDDGTSGTVGQYATDYYDLTPLVGSDTPQLAFSGDRSVELLTPPPGGAGVVWWSGRGDSANSRLTREIDLRGARSPILSFDLWTDLEPMWDYGYVTVSTDGGESWRKLATTESTDDNPNGGNYGSGVTGRTPGWVEQGIDLSEYAGGRVLLRFETVTDDTVSLTGMAVSDVRIEEAGATVDDDQDWVAEGWSSTPTELEQRWALQLVVLDEDGVSVRPIPVDESGRGTVSISDLPADARATLAVSALTSGPRAPAAYRLRPGGFAAAP